MEYTQVTNMPDNFYVEKCCPNALIKHDKIYKCNYGFGIPRWNKWPSEQIFSCNNCGKKLQTLTHPEAT